MPQLRAASVDAPDAQRMLAEYFGSREIGFAEHGVVYTARFPEASVFTPPAGVFVLVEDDDGEVVGCGGVRRIPDGPIGPRYEVKHLYLRSETRGRGWGRLLFADLEDRARRFGAAELVLDTHHSLTAAAALYAGAGFEPTEPYNDNPNATRWYRKELA